MHTIWLIEEIADIILSYCDKATLRQIARTCYHLSELAGNSLYQVINDPRQLLARMPYKWQSRFLTAEDVQRLDRRFVHTRIVCFNSHSSFSDRNLDDWYPKNAILGWKELWQDIDLIRNGTPAWPRLRQIRFHTKDQEMLLPFLGMTGNSLSRIKMCTAASSNDRAVCQRLLHDLGETSRLTSIHIHSNDLDLLPGRLLKSPHLRHLTCIAWYSSSTRNRIRPGYRTSNWLRLRQQLAEISAAAGITIDIDEARNLLSQDKSRIATIQRGYTIPTITSLSALHALHFALVLTQSYGVTGAERDGQDTSWEDRAGTAHETCDHGCLQCVIRAARRLKDNDATNDIALRLGGCYEAVRSSRKIAKVSAAHAFHSTLLIISPMASLRTLKLPESPDFLMTLDRPLYTLIATGLANLRGFHIHLPSNARAGGWHGSDMSHCRVQVPLHNIATFCHMLPELKEVTLSSVCIDESSSVDRGEAQSLGVYKLELQYVYPAHRWDLLPAVIKDYFPNSDVAKGFASIALDGHEHRTLEYFATLGPEQLTLVDRSA